EAQGKAPLVNEKEASTDRLFDCASADAARSKAPLEMLETSQCGGKEKARYFKAHICDQNPSRFEARTVLRAGPVTKSGMLISEFACSLRRYSKLPMREI